MSLEDLGNIGEFVAAICVVVSLIYLAVQIRQNTQSLRASAFQASTTRASEFTRALAEQKELTHIYLAGLRGWEQLEDDEDRFRFGMLLSTMFRQFDDLFFQYRTGNLSPESWETWRNAIRPILANPGFSTFWEARRRVFTESFRQFVEAERKTAEALPTTDKQIDLAKGAT